MVSFCLQGTPSELEVLEAKFDKWHRALGLYCDGLNQYFYISDRNISLAQVLPITLISTGALFNYFLYSPFG